MDLIRAMFPEREGLVERAFHESRPFRALCEDYRECAAVLQHWEQRDAPEAPSRRQEYEELQRELGREVQTWLEAMEAGSSHTTKEPHRTGGESSE